MNIHTPHLVNTATNTQHYKPNRTTQVSTQHRHVKHTFIRHFASTPQRKHSALVTHRHRTRHNSSSPHAAINRNCLAIDIYHTQRYWHCSTIEHMHNTHHDIIHSFRYATHMSQRELNIAAVASIGPTQTPQQHRSPQQPQAPPHVH